MGKLIPVMVVVAAEIGTTLLLTPDAASPRPARGVSTGIGDIPRRAHCTTAIMGLWDAAMLTVGVVGQSAVMVLRSAGGSSGAWVSAQSVGETPVILLLPTGPIAKCIACSCLTNMVGVCVTSS